LVSLVQTTTIIRPTDIIMCVMYYQLNSYSASSGPISTGPEPP